MLNGETSGVKLFLVSRHAACPADVTATANRARMRLGLPSWRHLLYELCPSFKHFTTCRAMIANQREQMRLIEAWSFVSYTECWWIYGLVLALAI
jgi:hypothetical protein